MSAQSHQPLQVDRQYYQNTGGLSLARRISGIARRRIHHCFLETMRPQPTERILDLGASDDTGTDANMLEQTYPHRANLTCASLSDGQAIVAAYPGVRHVQITPGHPLPFEPNAFDIVYSSAVLEHVGSSSQQRFFLEEMCRLARRRFLAVPNRGFPLEHHTCLPFVHYLPKAWFRRLLRGTRYDFWSYEANLNHVSAHDLRAMWPDQHPPVIIRAGIGFGPWRSNLIAYQS
jgi:ubiquinone/menaquinone biosynthesis C-methylase UbiE